MSIASLEIKLLQTVVIHISPMVYITHVFELSIDMPGYLLLQKLKYIFRNEQT